MAAADRGGIAAVRPRLPPGTRYTRGAWARSTTGTTSTSLTRTIADESVDLGDLDPPFDSAQNDNAFFQEKDGTLCADKLGSIRAPSWNSSG